MPYDPASDRDVAEPMTLDIVIPVYNEGLNIIPVLTALDAALKTPAHVLICYDFEEDDTLVAIREQWHGALPISFVRNPARGAHSAVMAGLRHGKAPYALVFPADDDYNVVMLDEMVAKAMEGNDIVCASRFMPGGSMVGCPWLKALLVRSAAFTLHRIARVPTHDATNGLRLFSRSVVERVPLESTEGFTFSLEWLVKVHRLRWPIAEIPARWIERQHGKSRFKVLRWIPAYMRWYSYAFCSTFAGRLSQSVRLNQDVGGSRSSETAS